MTPYPRKWKELPSGISAAHQALVAAMRQLRECSPRTQHEIARDAHLAATTLSNHLNAGRVPEKHLLRDFYKVVEKDAASPGLQLPHALDALLEMRLDALEKHCHCCHVGYPPTPREGGEPASRTVQSRHGRRQLRLRRHARRLENQVLAAQMRVPVPLQAGDRHPAEAAEVVWTELGVVTRYLAEGRKRDADLMLWRAGMSFSAGDVLNVVASCRSAGLTEAAETVLVNAGERADKQAVLDITAALHRAGRHEDAALILAAATRGTG
ncbi:hypothetical protein [Streptomyces sp. V1I1]|uniref:hypothetical protein n=1 Tax=Streptomyces sp. V1I1 TaxID=3042272 RepID=UPI00277DA920|nr:hypothetical protein [Streptomyces sp. V1I1]MDQ0943185.1 hypothetical protein [Streptomyces sp. V1I1]